MTFDPKYRMKFRPTSIRRLAKYETLPPQMVGDPFVQGQSWDARCRAIYAYMMEIKRGVIPVEQRRGLWFHA